MLAETLDYAEAAKRLEVSVAELKRLIAELEDKLCLNLFKADEDKPTLTDEGRFLLTICHNRLQQEGAVADDDSSENRLKD